MERRCIFFEKNRTDK